MDWLPNINNNEDKTWIPRVPSCFLNALFTNQLIQIVLPGTQKRCYTYIDDAVEGILSVVNNWDKCRGEILNIGNPKNEVTIELLAGIMCSKWNELTGRSPKNIVYISGENLYGIGYEDSERRLFSNQKMKLLTGWEANITIEETIGKTVSKAIEVYKNYEGSCIRSS